MIIPTKSGVEKGEYTLFYYKNRVLNYFLLPLDPAPQVTSTQAVPSPPPPDAGRRNKEETPNFEERDGVQDNSTLKQGDTMLVTCVYKI